MVTLKDVAARANVSFSTVSRAINEPARVNVDTRARVQEAIQHLGYVPHRAARRLRGRSMHAQIFGLLIPDIDNPFYSGIIRGVEDRAFTEGYAVILSNTNEDPARERFYLDVLRQEAAAGAILPPFSDGDEIPYNPETLGFPVVCFDRRPEIEGVDTVVVDNEQGAFDAVSHLIGLGHQRIGLVVASLDLSTSRERAAGYRRAHAEHGLPVLEDVVRVGEPRVEAGRELTADLLNLSEPPTALFAGNNVMAMGALTAAQSLGVSIPDDLSLVGFDDPPWFELVYPPLTTIRQPTFTIGQTAADLLLRRVEDPNRDATLVELSTELVVRGSCARPA